MNSELTLDRDLIKKAMEVSGFETEKEAVEAALGEFIHQRTRKDLRDLVGKIRFADGYDARVARGKAD